MNIPASNSTLFDVNNNDNDTQIPRINQDELDAKNKVGKPQQPPTPATTTKPPIPPDTVIINIDTRYKHYYFKPNFNKHVYLICQVSSHNYLNNNVASIWYI